MLLPRGATDCGKIPSFVPVRWPRSPGVAAEELTLSAAEDVATALEEHGLGDALPLPNAPRYVVWAWPATEDEVTTRTLRISGVSAALSFAPAVSWPVLVNSLSQGPRSWPGEVTNDELGVTFVAGKPATDYVAKLAEWVRNGGAPLVEARAGSSIFGWSIVADTVSLPPLVRSYARVATEEREDVDADRCTMALQALEDGGASDGTACGGATDASLALAATGLGPVLQRFVLSGSEPAGADALREGGEPRLAALRAKSVDDRACPEVVVTPPIVLPPGGGGNTGGRGGSDPVVVEEPVVVQEPYASEGCSCSPRRDPYYEDRSTTVTCFGDTSTSAGDDSCASDTSSSSSDDSCASDTSSSSRSSDDGCASDTNSSSSDDSCSGSSDSSYDGDTCTGRAAPEADAEPNATQASLTSARKGRPQRLRLSLWSLALAAVLLPIRRRKREGVR
ncbi:MAG: hypothetical protein K0R38_376 [Polyangiaceae bacterium]|nr:hypothetical protein [Polyangiaceae bacterium]